MTRDQIRTAILNATSMRGVTLPKGGQGWFLIGEDTDGVETEDHCRC